MQAAAKSLLLALAIGLTISACGQKGPLYLPGRSSTFESMTPEQRPATDNESQSDNQSQNASQGDSEDEEPENIN